MCKRKASLAVKPKEPAKGGEVLPALRQVNGGPTASRKKHACAEILIFQTDRLLEKRNRSTEGNADLRRRKLNENRRGDECL